jgi:5'(3')-deoxyribonucleotidase
MTLFIDLDGVLADFDTAYAAIAGAPPNKLLDNVDWRKIVAAPGFYAEIPPMPDMEAFWAYITTFPDVVILTGVPTSVPKAADDKRAWVTKHLGAHVKMIACKSREKCLYAKPGDVLVDDWEKYRANWLKAGGVWITHTSAAESIAALAEMASK